MIREKKQFSFLLPAVLTIVLVFHMLPKTQVVLREIPERLALAAEVEAKEPIRRKTADDGNMEVIPAATGDFTDGIYTGTSNGYGGEITVRVTVENGQIADILILSAPGETDPYFSLAKSLLDIVKQRQTWEVDTISGATYSSRGILGAIQNAITGEIVENDEPPSVEPVGTTSQDTFKDPAAYKDGTYYGTASGFGGSIKVEVVIKDGKIVSIRVIEAPGETGDYLARGKSVIQRILSKGSPNVDAVSGATYSSTGIINAVKRALSKAASDGKEEISFAIEDYLPPDLNLIIERPEDPDETFEYVDGVYYGTAEGFGGKIKVEVTVKKGKIAKISVKSAPDETPEFLNKAKGVISRIIKAGSPDVDVVSGATYSSTGIINAVRQALKDAAVRPGGGEGGSEGDAEGGEGGSEGGEGGEGGSGDGETTDTQYQDGTYTGSGWCDDGEDFYYEINVSIRVEEGKITSVSVTKGEDESESPEDNDFYLGWAVNGRMRSGVFRPGIPEQIVSRQSADVDTVSGATYSSDTIRSIVARIISSIPEAENKEEETQPGDTADVPADTPEVNIPAGLDQEEPSDTEEPADGEKPTNGEEPADAEEPTDTEEPTDGEEPADAEEPTDTEEPTDGEESADAEEPTDSEELADTEEPTDSEEPADTEEPVVGEDTPESEGTPDEEDEPEGGGDGT